MSRVVSKWEREARPEDWFVQVPKLRTRDGSVDVSLTAKGLYMELWCDEDEYVARNYTKAFLMERYGCGRRMFDSALAELVAAGLIDVVSGRNEQGHKTVTYRVLLPHQSRVSNDKPTRGTRVGPPPQRAECTHQSRILNDNNRAKRATREEEREEQEEQLLADASHRPAAAETIARGLVEQPEPQAVPAIVPLALSLLPERVKPTVVKPPRQRDPLIDALAAVDIGNRHADLSQVTPGAWRRAANAAAQIRPLGADAEEVFRRARAYGRLRPTWQLTAMALVSHWGELGEDAPPPRPTHSTAASRQGDALKVLYQQALDRQAQPALATGAM